MSARKLTSLVALLFATLVVLAPQRAAAQGGPPQMQAPQDGSADAPNLPPGTLEAAIVDGNEQPVPGITVELGVLHSSVADGNTREKIDQQTNAEGRLRFDGLEVGMAHSYRLTVTRGGATFSTPPFQIKQGQGKRALLHVYETTNDPRDARVGMESMVFVTLKEDALHIEQMFNVYNFGSKAWLAQERIQLPEEFSAFVADENQGGEIFDELPDIGVVLRGTFPPGKKSGVFRYQVPFDGDSSQAFDIGLPSRTIRARVIAQASAEMDLSVGGFPVAERVDGRDGRRLLLTEMTSMGEGISNLKVTLTGLPTPGPGRWVAVLLAVLAIGAAGSYVHSRRQAQELPEDTRQDLLEARETLLVEMVSVERAHQRGEIGPKSYARIRGALLDALARITTQLEDGRPRNKKRRRKRAAAA